MKVHLTPEVKITEIKREFKKTFPYLKLEFVKKKHGIKEGNSIKDIVSGNPTLNDVTSIMKEGDIVIGPWQTVAEVEQLFQSKFNLPVQIFRKARYSALETTKTDYLTLEKQNKMGREACHEMYDQDFFL